MGARRFGGGARGPASGKIASHCIAVKMCATRRCGRLSFPARQISPAPHRLETAPPATFRRHQILRRGARAERRLVRAAAAAKCTRCSAKTARENRTLIKVITGAHQPDGGTIRIAGEAVATSHPGAGARARDRLHLSAAGAFPGSLASRKISRCGWSNASRVQRVRWESAAHARDELLRAHRRADRSRCAKCARSRCRSSSSWKSPARSAPARAS